MNLYLNQSQEIVTEPLRYFRTQLPIEDAEFTVELQLHGAQISGSLVTLAHESGGVYSVKYPILTTLVDKANYKMYAKAKKNNVIVWDAYFDVTALKRVNPGTSLPSPQSVF